MAEAAQQRFSMARTVFRVASGNFLEMYDFMVFGYFSAAIGRAYFPASSEFAALGGKDPEEFRRQWWLQGLVVKAGTDGLTAYTEYGAVRVPALANQPVVDTTGAGDALAGGMLARWLSTGGQPGGLQDALVWGVACASITIGSIGVKGIDKATPEELAVRVAEVEECLRRES